MILFLSEIFAAAVNLHLALNWSIHCVCLDWENTQHYLDMLTCLPFLSCQPTQLLPSRLYLILYRWANSLPMPSAWRPWVPTSVMKCSERRSTWRYSLRPSDSDMMSGHQAPSPSPLSRSSLEKRRRQLREETGGRVQRRKGAWQLRGRERRRQRKRGIPILHENIFGYFYSTRVYLQPNMLKHAARWREATKQTEW